MIKVKNKIKVYSTPFCPWCERVKEFLKQNKIDFETVDVTESRENSMELLRKSGQMAVPVIDIDDEVIIGFDESKIRKILGLK